MTTLYILGMLNGALYIDVTELTDRRFRNTGIQRVVYEVVRELLRIDPTIRLIHFRGGGYRSIVGDVDSLLALYHHGRLFERLRATYRHLPLPARRAAAPGIARSRAAVTRIRSSFRRSHLAPEDHLVVLGNLWTYPAQLAAVSRLASRGVEVTTLVHDLIPLTQRHTTDPLHQENFRRYLSEVVRISGTLLTNSDVTTRDLQTFVSHQPHRPDVVIEKIRFGDSPRRPRQRPVESLADGPFALVVAPFEARKNHMLLYLALKLAADEGTLDQLPQYCLVARRGFGGNDVGMLFRQDAQIAHKITVLSNVSDGQLDWLYRNAEYTVFTSQYEGWGLPVAESVSRGTPCITTRGTAMEEVAPGVVQLVSAFDTRGLLDAMLDYTDERELKAARELIAINWLPTPWESTAHAVLRVVRGE